MEKNYESNEGQQISLWENYHGKCPGIDKVSHYEICGGSSSYGKDMRSESNDHESSDEELKNWTERANYSSTYNKTTSKNGTSYPSKRLRSNTPNLGIKVRVREIHEFRDNNLSHDSDHKVTSSKKVI